MNKKTIIVILTILLLLVLGYANNVSEKYIDTVLENLKQGETIRELKAKSLVKDQTIIKAKAETLQTLKAMNEQANIYTESIEDHQEQIESTLSMINSIQAGDIVLLNIK